MWRTIGPYGGGSDRNQFIFQLNQAAKKVMSDMDIPIFRWSDFLSGTQEDNQYNDGRTDNLHFITGCECAVFNWRLVAHCAIFSSA